MLDWTDRHCRFFHRLLTRRALLYTEMVVADAVIHGRREALLSFDAVERPLALQLGGSDPQKLAQAAKIAVDFGYDEINLNVGCPSDRVQSGAFGACLLRTPEVVARAVAAMKQAISLPITVKCRIGVDEQDEEEALDCLADLVWKAGCDGLWVHARKAWLKGLSPKENRDIPPLNYERVYRLKARNQQKFIGMNGGIKNISEAKNHLQYCDAVMVGRAAYHEPAILRMVDQVLYGEEDAFCCDGEIIEAMTEYAQRHCATGGKLSSVLRPMIGFFYGRIGARRWRQLLSNGVISSAATPDLLRMAHAEVLALNTEAQEQLNG